MLGIFLYSYAYLNWQKCFVSLIVTYIFSSKKLEKMAEQALPGSEGGVGEREETGARGRNAPNNVCTYE
jgi:hypothetical protein